MNKPYALFEGATSVLVAAIVWHGVLLDKTDLQSAAHRAVAELQTMGFAVPTTDSPVHIHPLKPSGAPSSNHAAGWSPGSIWLREAPEGVVADVTYLRHELMHEAMYRTCRRKLPEWVKEGAAIAFSGEGQVADIELSSGDLRSLGKAVQLGASLSRRHRSALAHLVVRFGWPATPCAVSNEILGVLSEAASSQTAIDLNASSGTDYLVMDAISGRVVFPTIDQIKKQDSRVAPIGSLMKLPYMANLPSGESASIGVAIARSDTDFFERRGSQELRTSLCKLLSLFSPYSACQHISIRTLLGESDSEIGFPFQYSLYDTALLLRAAVYQDPGHLQSVPEHQDTPGATLFSAPESFSALLSRNNALVKTGTTSTFRGEPLWGHIAVIWPRSAPRYIALFREKGVRGAALAESVLGQLQSIFNRGELRDRAIAVPLLSQLPRASYQILAQCVVSKNQFGEQCEVATPSGIKVSSSGWWKITTTAMHARPLRFLRGVISADGRTLLTDPESYVDGVMSAEGSGLPVAAREALRAVVYWNGAHGRARHTTVAGAGVLDPAVCDTTHCMVFLGTGEVEQSKTQLSLIQQLHLLDLHRPLSERGWFEYASGGSIPWKKRLAGGEIARKLGVERIAHIVRERTREGAVVVHVDTLQEQRTVNCDKFMVDLDLPSCPDQLRIDGEEITIEGKGSGHARGLDLTRAADLARGGSTAREILQDAYGS